MTIAIQPSDVATVDRERSRARKAALGSFVGAVVDWYDFLLYGIIAAIVFNTEFFPKVSPAMGTLAAFGTFGVGFLFRPLGGFVFGHYGDRLGRKAALVVTLLLMGIATFLVAIVPGYQYIGIWGAVLLTVLRFVQGIDVRVVAVSSIRQLLHGRVLEIAHAESQHRQRHA